MTVTGNKTPKRRVQIINGVSRVYEDHPYWDTGKKQCRHRRTYIGHLDANGIFIANKSFLAGQAASATEIVKAADRRFFGAGYLLDHVGQMWLEWNGMAWNGLEPGLFHSPFWQRCAVVFSLYFRCSRQFPERKNCNCVVIGKRCRAHVWQGCFFLNNN